jgi:hypothetical protein
VNAGSALRKLQRIVAAGTSIVPSKTGYDILIRNPMISSFLWGCPLNGLLLLLVLKIKILTK